MHIYTNSPTHGGTFGSKIGNLLESCSGVTIASGYTSEDVLRKHAPYFNRIADEKGDVNLLIGMARFEGLSQTTYDKLCEINVEIRDRNPVTGGVRVVWQPTGFHGKMYRVEYGHELVYLAGSSNFSRTGLYNNLEFSCEITDSETVVETEAYLAWLLADEQSINIGNIANFPIMERARVPRQTAARRRRPRPICTAEYADIRLRVDQQPMSGVNAFFGKGRLNKATSIVTPRGWFEVEIIVDIETTRNPIYPEGDFQVRTDDGEEFQCRTQGAYHKNLRSRDDLKILGRWIKGKLQRAEVLRPFEAVTSSTLQAYGRDYIRLYRIAECEYLLEF